MKHMIAVPTLDAADIFIMLQSNQSYFSTRELSESIDCILIDKFMDIQFSVESDSHLKHLDYTMMEMDEIADIVETYSDLI